MNRTSICRRILGMVVCLALANPFLPPSRAGSPDLGALPALRRQADQLERLGLWEQACDLYEDLLRLDRNQPQVRARYRQCLRRAQQSRRYRDLSYCKEVLSLKYPEALDLYSVVVRNLLTNALDRQRVSPGDVFRKGLEELRFALEEPTFCQEFLPGVPAQAIRAFQERLAAWPVPAKLTRPQLRDQVREVAMAALHTLNLPATPAVLEFTCGACYAFDEYTIYLTPDQLQELYDSLKGQYVGVGVRLAVQDNHLIITEVDADSPAGEIMPPLRKDDQLVSVDQKATAGLTAEAGMDLLEGASGTTVELVVYTPSMGTRTVVLQRRPLFVPSVTCHMKSAGIGYVQIACFQESTIQELDAALSALTKAEMRVLLLDLRGNAGGLVESAVEAARRFLPTGVIVSTRNQDPRQNTVYQARNPGALTLPMVALVDGETASAAEVLAGALKDNKRARLVGQATFGKGCSQSVLKLPPGPGGVPTGGIRLTVARLFSPSGNPYTCRGVVPHVITPRRLTLESLDDNDNQLATALKIAEEAR